MRSLWLSDGRNVARIRVQTAARRLGAKHRPLHRLAQIMGHDFLDTTMVCVRGTCENLRRNVE